MEEIYQYLRMLRRGWWVIALSTLAAFNLALTLAYLETPQYRTSARFLLSPTANLPEYRDFMSAMNPLDDATLTATYAEILQSNYIFSRALTALRVEPDRVSDYNHQAVVLPQSNVLELSVTGSDPELIADIANMVGYQSVAYIEDVYPIFDLRVLDEAAAPSSPFTPNPKRDAMISAILGFALGVGILLAATKIQLVLESINETAAEEDAQDSENLIASQPIQTTEQQAKPSS